MDDEPVLSKLGAMRVQFWICPKRAHHDRTGPQGERLATVEWRDGVAYCLTPGCGRSSVDDFSRR